MRFRGLGAVRLISRPITLRPQFIHLTFNKTHAKGPSLPSVRHFVAQIAVSRPLACQSDCAILPPIGQLDRKVLISIIQSQPYFHPCIEHEAFELSVNVTELRVCYRTVVDCVETCLTAVGEVLEVAEH